MKYYGLAVAAVIAFQSNQAAAQNTDAAATLNAVLAKLGPMSVTTPYSVEVEYQECRTHISHSRNGPGEDYETCEKKRRTETRQRTDQTTLTVRNVSLIFPNKPEFGKETYSDIPSDVIENSTQFINCSDGQGSYNVGLSVTAVRSQSISISNSVTNTIGGSVKFGIKPFGVGADVTLTYSNASTSGESKTEGSQGSYTITNSGSVSVSPMKGIVATLRSYKLQAMLPFTVRGVIDGDVNANDQGIKRASDRISESDRTVTVSGVVMATDYSEGKLLIFQVKDACLNNKGQSQSAFTPSTNQKLYLAPKKIFKMKASPITSQDH